jgi:hypothetical protein
MTDQEDIPEFYDPASDQLRALAYCLDALAESAMGVDQRISLQTKEDVMRAMSRIACQLGSD